MRVNLLLCAALGVLAMPAIALADDPLDPTMRSAAARARDHERIRQLNLAELARVQQRDTGYAQGWQDWRDARERAGRYSEGGEGSDGGQYAARSREYARANSEYADSRARYERDMAEWRRTADACRAGDWDACQH